MSVKKSNNSKSEMSIVAALDVILSKAKESKLSAKFWRSIKKETDFLKVKLEGFSEFQMVILAVLIDAGRPMSWKTFGDFFGLSRLNMMTYTEEIEDLIRKRWVKPDESNEFNGRFVGYGLERGVVTAIRHNKPFEPELLEGLTTQQVVDKANRMFRNDFDVHNPEKDYLYEWVDFLVNNNKELPLCERMINLDLDMVEKTVFMLVVTDYAYFGNTEREGLSLGDLELFLPNEVESELLLRDLREGAHPLFSNALVEHGCDDGIEDTEKLLLTRTAREELLADYQMKAGSAQKKNESRDLKKCADIKNTELFYNPDEEKQVAQLTELLQPERFDEVQRRLEERGLRKGFACLFYGAPGTGKTETVMQIARQTGRDIMTVEISGMKDKWVGESEKNIKAVFHRYRQLCKNSERTPILFFNESDALINKRSNSAESSVDKMNNAMQNILLQEMEELEGILIATTNLTECLDQAFERRFIYKIDFKQPNVEVKAKIWQSKIGGLDDADVAKLARNYDLSGGQIENIARKTTVDYVLYGKNPDYILLDEYCKNEVIASKNKRSVVGFL